MLKYISLFLILFLEIYPQGSVTVNRKSYWDNREAGVADTTTNLYVSSDMADDSEDGLTFITAKKTSLIERLSILNKFHHFYSFEIFYINYLQLALFWP